MLMLFIIVLVCYLLLVLNVFFRQEGMIFRYSRKMFETPAEFDVDFEDIDFASQDGTILNGWFVPATTLLDRLLLMKKVRLRVSKHALFVTNFNSCNVDGITVLVHPNEVLYNARGIAIKANEEGDFDLKILWY